MKKYELSQGSIKASLNGFNGSLQYDWISCLKILNMNTSVIVILWRINDTNILNLDNTAPTSLKTIQDPLKLKTHGNRTNSKKHKRFNGEMFKSSVNVTLEPLDL